MRVKAVLFVSLALAALTLAPLYAHVLEWPGKVALRGMHWLAVQHNLYGGYAVSGAVTETLGLFATLVLGFLVRRHHWSRAVALIAALCYVGMLAIFALGSNPINTHIASWTASTLPANWSQTRDAWQTFHMVSATMAAVAFGALLVLGVAPFYRGAASIRQASQCGYACGYRHVVRGLFEPGGR